MERSRAVLARLASSSSDPPTKELRPVPPRRIEGGVAAEKERRPSVKLECTLPDPARLVDGAVCVGSGMEAAVVAEAASALPKAI